MYLLVVLQKPRPHPGGGWCLHADHKHVDPRLVGTRTLMIKIPETPPCYLTTNQSEQSPQATTRTPSVLFKKKNPSLKAIREFESFEHELSSLFPFVVQSLSRVQLLVTPWTVACRLPCPTLSQSLLKLMSIESVMPSSHFILCRPLFLLPSIFPSINVSSIESTLCIRWPKYWSFSISPSSEYPGLISFSIDWFHLLAVQGPLKSPLQHHS